MGYYVNNKYEDRRSVKSIHNYFRFIGKEK